MSYTYILKCVDNSYYTGSTKNLEQRLWQHQNGQGAYHTKIRLPVTLVYVEHYDRVEEAFAREKQIQGWSRRKKEALIEGDMDALRCLSLSKANRIDASTSSATDISTNSTNNIIKNIGAVTELAEVK